MKWLNDEKYDALKAKADNYDTVVSAVLANNVGLTAEEVTPSVITEALNASGTEDNSELQSQLAAAEERAETAEKQVSQLTSEVETLTSENANLKKTPAAGTSTVNINSDTTEVYDIVKFANENKGDTTAIMNELREKEGYK